MGVTGISLERKVGLGSTRGKESDRWYMDDFGVVYTKYTAPHLCPQPRGFVSYWWGVWLVG